MTAPVPSRLDHVLHSVGSRMRELRRRLIVTLQPILPKTVRRALRQIERACDPLFVGLYRLRTGERRPIPPKLLRDRVSETSPTTWFAGGEPWARSVSTMLDRVGASLEDQQSVLDFGCGAGRVLQHLYGKPGLELHGCDIHAGSIEWCRKAFPAARFRVNAFSPPLDYDAECFDVIYAWSVFTHIDEEKQRLWLAELRRVLRPGGLLLASVLSDPALDRTADGHLSVAERERQFGAAGFLFEPYDVSRASDPAEWSGTTETYGMAFHSADYLRTEWSRYFEVLDLVPRALIDLQDVAILRRP